MSWRLARSLASLAAEVDARWPGTTIWTIGDADHRDRASDHNPTSAGVVCAIDVLGHRQSDALWKFLLDTRDERVKYAIHDQRIVSATVSPWRVRRYTGSNPHTNHIHISVGRGNDGSSTRADLYDDPSGWGLTSGTPAPDPEDEQMLTRGDTGPAVRLLQSCLQREARARQVPDPLSGFGVDGDYGTETEAAVRDYQEAAGIDQTGNADGVTCALLFRWEDQ